MTIAERLSFFPDVFTVAVRSIYLEKIFQGFQLSSYSVSGCHRRTNESLPAEATAAGASAASAMIVRANSVLHVGSVEAFTSDSALLETS